MSKSLLYAVNTASQTVAVGGTVSFGEAVRRYGCNCKINSGNAVVSGRGYYSIDADVTVTPGADGTVVITLYKDGVAIPGAVASQYITTDGAWTIHVPTCIVRVTGNEGCCCGSGDGSDTITAVLTGTAGTVSLASIAVVKE